MQKIKMVLAGALLVLVPLSEAQALALAEIKVNSYINQPLNATIELTSASNDELDNLNTIITKSKKSNSNQGYWSSLKVELVRMEQGKSYLKLTSKDNVREPVLNFLLELSWSKGRLQREYSLLLNLPD